MDKPQLRPLVGTECGTSVLCPACKEPSGVDAVVPVDSSCHLCPHFGGYKNPRFVKCSFVGESRTAGVGLDVWDRNLSKPTLMEILIEGQNLDLEGQPPTTEVMDLRDSKSSTESRKPVAKPWLG
jgi:hypothetical protein